jgi:hypothetical protein
VGAALPAAPHSMPYDIPSCKPQTRYTMREALSRMASTDHEKDFGYGDIPWEDATDENVAAVEAEYRARLTEASSAWSDIEQKARFAFSGLLAITTAVAGWTFVHASGMEPPFLMGLLTLTSCFAVAALAAAFALFPQTYGASSGVRARLRRITATV